MNLYLFSKQTGGESRFSQKRGQIGGPKPKLSVFFEGLSSKMGLRASTCPLLQTVSPRQTVHPVRCCIIRYSTSQFHRKYYFGQEEEEMKLCLMILSVPWYMLEHTAILSHFLTFIHGKWVRVGRVRVGKDTS